MSLKQDLKGVKEEFKSDEKMLESVFRLEAFYKKYKIWIWGLLIGIVAVIAGYQINLYLKEKNALEISALFAKAKEDKQALQELKAKNQELYDFIVFSNALNEGNQEVLKQMSTSKNPFIANYATYELDSLMQTFQKSRDYGDFKDFVLLQEGYLKMMNQERKEAMEILKSISPTSELRDLALRMEHYGIND